MFGKHSANIKEKMQFAVIGLGRFGKSVAKTLASHGVQVLAVDKNAEVLNDISDSVTYTVCTDITNPVAVADLALENYNAVVIGMSGCFEDSVLATILVKEAGVKNVIVKAKSEIEGRVLLRVGADTVKYPESEIGQDLANKMVGGNYVDAIGMSDDHSIVEVALPAEWIGKTIGTLNIRKEFELSIIAIKRAEGVVANPGSDEELKEYDRIVILGRNSRLEKMTEKYGD